MNNEEKSMMYGRLLNEHTRVGNEISEIKGQDIDLNTQQREKIKQLERRQLEIMNALRRLFN